MTRKVTIVGAGPGAPGLATVAGATALAEADIVIGASRLLEGLPEDRARIAHAAVRADDIERLLKDDGSWRRACLLMSGDTGLFSGTKRLLERLGCFEVQVVPGISSAQLLAARLGRPWQNWRFASAHGVACDIADVVARNPETFLVTGGDNSVESLCARLAEAGWGNALVSVGERLSYPDERITCKSAAELSSGAFDPLSVMLIDRPAVPEGRSGTDLDVSHGASDIDWPFATHGIPDALFTRGGVPMTKQEVRAVALSKLGIARTDTVYDVGAGTGSVTIEAALAARDGRVFAIERNPEGCALVRDNAKRFGARNVTVVEGRAPNALADLPAPDAAFIGGSGGGLEQILDALLAKNPRVRVCVTCIALETLSQAASLLARAPFTGFEASQVSAARATKAGPYHLMKSENPVFIVTARGDGSAR